MSREYKRSSRAQYYAFLHQLSFWLLIAGPTLFVGPYLLQWVLPGPLAASLSGWTDLLNIIGIGCLVLVVGIEKYALP